MSAITYSEPYKLPAGALALLVHAAFFALLYFGISWRAEPPQGMVVDIWDSLPAPQAAPARVEPAPEPVKPTPPPKPVEVRRTVEPARALTPPKAEIELADKKKSNAKPVEIKKVEELVKPEPPKKQAEPPQPDQKALAAQAEQERARAAQAALGKLLDDYKSRIIAKIRRNIVMPPDVAESARAEFDVTVLPGGSVMNVKLIIPSGNEAYDSAVERAINKAQPLPVPQDISTFNKFRELHLKFCPVSTAEGCK